MQIPFIGGEYASHSTNLNAQVCQNFYVVKDDWGGKSVVSLRGTPGMKAWKNLGTGEVRALYHWLDYVYAVVGSTLYKINEVGHFENVGTLLTTVGKVWIAGGTTHLMLTDGTYGYYRTQTATRLTTITDADFPDPSSLTYQDGYFIVTADDSDAIYISASEDASSWDGLDFASAEDTPDDALAVVSHNRELWILGEETTEIFYDSGDADFPFTRIAGAIEKTGLGAVRSLTEGYEGLFFLDNRWSVRMNKAGAGTVQISTPQIETQFAKIETKSDAIGYCYSQEGHSFYVLTFPAGDRTFAYDITTGAWHTRSTGLSGGRYAANCYAWAFGKHLVGHFMDGTIYDLDINTYMDGTEYIKSIRRAQVVHNEARRVFHESIQIDFEGGVGLDYEVQGTDPQAMLRWSDDGGHQWSNEHWASIGKIGEYGRRAIWRRLGSSRNRIYEVSITDPVKRVIIGAWLDAEAGAH